jgi:hypothetical protein
MLDSLVRVSRRVGGNHFVNPAHPRGSQRGTEATRAACTPTISDADPRTRKRTVASAQHWFHPVPFQQFQALFNSLFKVLCIFPSRYLFAIGLSPIFSFRRNLPPALSCNPKQPDSSTAGRTSRNRATDGIVTLSDALFQGTYARPASDTTSVDYNSVCTDLQHELFPLQSPLLRES